MNRVIADFIPSQDISVSELRTFNRNKLRQFKGMAIIRKGAKPLSVMIDYATYMKLQALMQTMAEIVEDSCQTCPTP